MTIGESIIFVAAVFTFLMAYGWAITFAGSLLNIPPIAIGGALTALAIIISKREQE